MFKYSVSRYDQFDVEAMITTNFKLRDKISDITKIVKQGIARAVEFKKKIITHRDLPDDPEVQGKTKQIQVYQAKMILAQKYIKSLQTKIDTMEGSKKIDSHGNKIKKLTKEIK